MVYGMNLENLIKVKQMMDKAPAPRGKVMIAITDENGTRIITVKPKKPKKAS